MILKSTQSSGKGAKASRRLYGGQEYLDLCAKAKTGEISIWRVEIVGAAKYHVSYTQNKGN